MPYLALVWLHVLAAIIWIGGMVFVGAILAPIARAMAPQDRAAVLHRVGLRFSIVGWVCIGVLLLTGPLMLSLRGRLELLVNPASAAGTTFGYVLLAKLGVIFVMVVLSLLHDFWLGPRLVGALASSRESYPTDPIRMRSLQRWVALLARLNLGLGVMVVALGVILARM